MSKVIVFGNGQSGTFDYMRLTDDSPHDVVAFTVDRAYIKEDTLLGLPVIPFDVIESNYPPSEYKMSIHISYRNGNKLRAEKYYQAKEKGYGLISYVSSLANIWSDAIIGENCVVAARAMIDAFVQIGNNVQIHTGSLIGHNVVVKDHCFIGPHAVLLGSTTVGPYCLIGANSTILDGGIVVARECTIGAGALITKDTQAGCVYRGRIAEPYFPNAKPVRIESIKQLGHQTGKSKSVK